MPNTGNSVSGAVNANYSGYVKHCVKVPTNDNIITSINIWVFELYKMDSLVMAKTNINGTLNNTGSDGKALVQIPEGYRPICEITDICVTQEGNPILCSINKDGWVILNTLGKSITEKDWYLRKTYTWICDDNY